MASISWKRERNDWEAAGLGSNDRTQGRGGMIMKSEMEFQFRKRLGSGGSEPGPVPRGAGQGGGRTVVPNRGTVRVIKGSSL